MKFQKWYWSNGSERTSVKTTAHLHCLQGKELFWEKEIILDSLHSDPIILSNFESVLVCYFEKLFIWMFLV